MDWVSKIFTGLPAGTILSALALAMSWIGCAVGPDYRQPATPEPAAFENAPGLLSTNAPPLTANWWESFNDPLLNSLVSESAANNHDLRRAQARLREARALWNEARFDYAPTIHANTSYDKFKLSDYTAGARQRRNELYRVGFDSTWELDFWGRVRRDVEAARATVESVEATRDDVLLGVQAEVAANYFEVIGTQGRLEVARRHTTNQAQSLNLAIALLEGGQGTQLDVARARSLLHETLASIPPLEAALHRAMYRISVLCGLPPATFTRELSVPRNFPSFPAELPLTSPTELLRNRPDVRAAERSLAAANARIGVEVADLFPRVTFVGTAGLEATSFSALSAAGSRTYTFGPHITWTAFDIGRVRQRIKAADARTEAALAIYEQTVLLALEETENSLVALSTERERLTYLAEAERAAAEAVELARQRYRDGIADYLSVLDAERTLLNLEEQRVNTQTLSALRLISLYKVFAAGLPVPR